MVLFHPYKWPKIHEFHWGYKIRIGVVSSHLEQTTIHIGIPYIDGMGLVGNVFQLLTLVFHYGSMGVILGL